MRSLLLCFLSVLACSVALPASADRSPSPLYPAGTALPGTALPQLSARWWQWAVAFPGVRDSTGAYCADGQEDSAWFLAGAFNPTRLERTCTVSHDRPLFFPLAMAAFWPSRNEPAASCADSLKESRLPDDPALEPFAELDGAPLAAPQELRAHRVTTADCFDAYARLPAGASLPGRGHPASTDGYWLLLHPLSPGPHTLRFGARYTAINGQVLLVQDTTYHLVVE